MDIENSLKEIIQDLLKFFSEKSAKIEITAETAEKDAYRINISGLNSAAMLIGYHGENLRALQYIFRIIAVKKLNQQKLNIILDIDNYKKEYEDNIISFAERKAEILRKTKKIQILPPMPSYLRKIIHMHFIQDKFSDIQTESIGEYDNRQITLKLK